MGDGADAVIPGWALRTIDSTAKAGNATYTLTPPANRRYEIVRARIAITCDATVANRNIKVKVQDGSGNSLGPTMTGTTVTATNSAKFAIAPAAAAPYGGSWSEDDAVFYLSQPIELSGAQCLVITVLNGVVGDSYRAFIQARECDG